MPNVKVHYLGISLRLDKTSNYYVMKDKSWDSFIRASIQTCNSLMDLSYGRAELKSENSSQKTLVKHAFFQFYTIGQIHK